jgi:hypothetical protein
MSTIKTLVLFVILAILAAYVYFYEIKGGEERDEADKIAKKILVVEPDSVRLIEIRSVFNRFIFERLGDDWRIKDPVKTGGDKSTIESLLTTLKNMDKIREFSINADEQKDYGLVGRSYLVIFELNSGRRDSLRFGDNTPVGSNVFVSKGDTMVYTIAANAKNTVTKNLFDWRDKSIAKVRESEISEFQLKNTKGSFKLVKEGSDWQLLKPKKVRGDNSTISALLRKFENGKAKSVVSESLDNSGQYNLKWPAYQIDLYVGEGKAHKQIILSKLINNASNVKDDSRPQVMTVDSIFIRDIDKTFFQLRYKKISEFDKNGVDSVLVTQGDSSLYFVKDTSDTWLLAGETKVKEWKMNSLLNSLNNLEAKKYLLENISSVTKYGLNRPERIIECFQKGERIQTLKLNTYRDISVAYCPTSEVVAEIDKNSFSNFEVKINDFIEKTTQSAGEIN